MAAVKSIRVQIYEALRDAITDVVLSDPAWGISPRHVVSEPSEAPQTEQFLSFRILSYNEQLDLIPQTFYLAASEDDPDVSISLVRSTLRVQCFGAQAWAWLDAFLLALGDDHVIRFFRERGFAVETDGSGITDQSALIGAREQTRGTASITVTCRAIRDRVITHADKIVIETELVSEDPDTPNFQSSTTVSLQE